MDVTKFDGWHCLVTVQDRFGGPQGSKALTVSEQPFQSLIITLNRIVSPLRAGVPIAVEVRVDFATGTGSVFAIMELVIVGLPCGVVCCKSTVGT